jgi:hypothetical protein
MNSSEEKIINAFKKKDWQESQSMDSWRVFKIISELSKALKSWPE